MFDFFKSHPSFFGILLSTLIGSSVAIIGIYKQRQTARHKNSIDFEADLEGSESYENGWAILKRLVSSSEKNPLSMWATETNFDSEEAQSIRTILNRWERASNGVAKKIYDDEFLYDMYGSHVISIHRKSLGYIIRVRQERQEKAFEQFLNMVEKWRERRRCEDLAKNGKKALIVVYI